MTTTNAARLAVDGGTPVRDSVTRPWPVWPIWGEAEERAILDVLHSGQWWSVGGARVPELEAAFAASQDANYAVAVTNGTAALEVVLRAMDIGCGDEVIVPPYTFIATASSVLAVGATPVFVDVEPGSLNIDPTKIEAAITPRTKAIIPVHIAGCPADMDGVMEIARRRDLRVIEDAAQAHAAEWRGRKMGAIGDAGTFSFQASKNLNAGEGGIIVTDDEELGDRIWSVHNVGRVRGGRWYEHAILGGNFRMTEWQAAILLAQMTRLEAQTAKRSENGAYLTTLLADLPGIRTLPPDSRVTRHAYHLYMFRIDSEELNGRSVESFVEAMNAEGIPCSTGYVPLYREALFKPRSESGPLCQARRRIDYGQFAELCPVCEEACSDTVWIGQHILLGSPSDMEDIAAAILKICNA